MSIDSDAFIFSTLTQVRNTFDQGSEKGGDVEPIREAS